MNDNSPKNQKHINPQWILFAFILTLVISTALTGWFSDTLYQNNPTDLIIKLRYYDLSLLVVVLPVSLIALALSIRNNKRARIFSLGLTFYLIFSFAVTIFTCSQNSLFLVYVAIIFLCFLYLTKGFLETYNTTSITIPKNISKIASMVLLFSAIFGFGYWLSDAVSALLSQSDENEFVYVYAPQVFDMAIALPLTAYGAIRFWRLRKDGILISLIMMIFFIFIGISVIIMEIGLSANTNAEMDYGKVYGYDFTTLMNIFITIFVYRKTIAEEIE